MSSYGIFANYYNQLTENISYMDRAKYFSSLVDQNGNGGKSLLDLACGTGRLSFALSKLGYSVIGSDSSIEMLTQAMMENEEGLLFLHQKMEKLALYEPVDSIICALDSLNHVLSLSKLQEIFCRVSNSLTPGGLFVFDVNSRHKQESILANNTFVYDLEDIYCVWQNTWMKEKSRTKIDLDLFVKNQKNEYKRYEEHFAEQVYDHEDFLLLTKEAGMEILHVYADDTLDPPNKFSQRLIYVVRKPFDHAEGKEK